MRRILPSTLLLLFLLGLPVGPGVRAQVQGFPQGVAAGDVAARAAVVWTRADAPAPVWVESAATPGFTGARTTTPFYTNPEHDYTANVELTGLDPGQRYYYRFATGSARSVSGTFVMPPAGDREDPVTLIWGADTAEDYKPFRVFRGMRARNADLFLYLGDTVYTDFGRIRAITLDQYRQKYQINREDQFLREYLTTTSTWVIWDDHEVENNFDSEHTRVETGLRAFREYWPIRPPPEAPGRLQRSFRCGTTVGLFILAARRVANVVFVGGDVHYAALLRPPEGPYEATSGPLAAILSRSSRVAGKPEALWSATGKFNYGWMRNALARIIGV